MVPCFGFVVIYSYQNSGIDAAVRLVGIVGVYNDLLDIVQDYGYRIETLPLPKRIKQGKTVALEFSIIREDYYKEAAYRFRYFQNEGEGILSYQGRAMSRFQNVPSDDFVLYYRLECDEQQLLDFVLVESTSPLNQRDLQMDV
jgi:hypothetical protein